MIEPETHTSPSRYCTDRDGYESYLAELTGLAHATIDPNKLWHVMDFGNLHVWSSSVVCFFYDAG